MTKELNLGAGSQPVSKVLVLDEHPAGVEAVRALCGAHRLVPVKASRQRLMAVLSSNIDLGAVFLAEDYCGSLGDTAVIAQRIHRLRPELPVFLRRTSTTDANGLPAMLRDVICAMFTADDTEPLQAALNEYLFSLEFPNALVRGISEITEARLASLFPQLSISRETPYIVRDRIIFGELFSLIPLESAWCRGYLLMQTEEQPLLDLLAGSGDLARDTGFRDVNSHLGELTNLIWGAFKDRFMCQPASRAHAAVQVPLIVNHLHRYISFGSTNPQLCFKYRLTDEASGRSVQFDQRFVFSLSWLPEDFQETGPDEAALAEDGELELF